jgi:hypothetical protein
MSDKDKIKEIFIKLLQEIDSRGVMSWDEIQNFLHEARGTKRKSRKTIVRRVLGGTRSRSLGTMNIRTTRVPIKDIIYPKRCGDVTLSFLKKEKRGIYSIHPEKLNYWKCNSVSEIKNPFSYSVKSKYRKELERPDYFVHVALKKMTGGAGIEEFI